MLNITNINLLKITKVKGWAIYFTYDNKRYLLHTSCEDYETSTELYYREPLNNEGKYKLQIICSKCLNQIPDLKNKKGKYYHNKNVLNYIDIRDFVWKMTWRGYFESEYTKEIEKRKQQLEDIDKTIVTLQDMKRQLHKL